MGGYRMLNKDVAIEKAKKVKFVILDIHGVLTDNILYYTNIGEEVHKKEEIRSTKSGRSIPRGSTRNNS